jgi:membrane protease YdiL (CAAX protease family)
MGPDAIGPRPHGERLPPLIAAGATAAVLFLVGVVAVAIGGGRSVTGHELEGDVPDLVGDLAYTMLIMIGIAVLAAVITVLANARKLRLGRRRMSSSRYIILLALAIMGAALFAQFIHRPHLRPVAKEGGAPGTAKQDSPYADQGKGEQPHFRWEVPLVLGVVGAAAAAYALRRRSKATDRGEPDDAAEAVSEALDEALDDLRAERDARRAVIAAYARLERTLAWYGLPRRASEAPLEYLSRILLELEVTPEAVFDLTQLFEQAQFSRRPIDLVMKEEAIGALTAVRDDLRRAA